MFKTLFLSFVLGTLFFLWSSLSFAQEEQPLPSSCPLTVQQYAEFLRAVAATDTYHLYNEKMGDDPLSACIIREGEPGFYTYEAVPDHADDPVSYVSHLSAKRYCNWLQNGKPEGGEDETTTERGAYTLDGTMKINPTREETANYFLPASSDYEIEPTLTSNLTTYSIVTHFKDAFHFITPSSDEEQTTWTVGGLILGIAGLAVAVRYHRQLPRFDEEQLNTSCSSNLNRTEQRQFADEHDQVQNPNAWKRIQDGKAAACTSLYKQVTITTTPLPLSPPNSENHLTQKEANQQAQEKWRQRATSSVSRVPQVSFNKNTSQFTQHPNGWHQTTILLSDRPSSLAPTETLPKEDHQLSLQKGRHKKLEALDSQLSNFIKTQLSFTQPHPPVHRYWTYIENSFRHPTEKFHFENEKQRNQFLIFFKNSDDLTQHLIISKTTLLENVEDMITRLGGFEWFERLGGAILRHRG